MGRQIEHFGLHELEVFTGSHLLDIMFLATCDINRPPHVRKAEDNKARRF